MYKLLPLLVLLVGKYTLAQNHSISYPEANDPQIDTRSIFSPPHRTQSYGIKYLQQRREMEATLSLTSGPEIQQQRQNNESEIDYIKRYFQQIAPSTPTAQSIPTLADSDELDKVIKRLQQMANRSVTPAPVRTTTSVVNTLPQGQYSRYPHTTVLSSTAVPDVDNGVEPCTLDSGEPGECVHFYQCHNGSANTDGGGSIDLRSGFTPCSSYLDVCCGAPDRVTPSLPPKPREGCGWRNRDGVGFRVTGAAGGEANFGEFPWMVAVLKYSDDFDNFLYAGGGSLIHPSIVLTAAHILTNATTLRVRAGEWDTQTKDEQYPYQDRDVAEVVVHKGFNRRNLFFDIALLFLSAPVDLAPHIGVACLPRAAAVAADGARCFASGWGKDKFGKEGQYQAILKRVEVPVVGRARCVAALRRTRLGRRFQLHASFLCAGARGQDACTGDGGSPLVCPTQSADRYVQHGIVAWGIGCGGEAPGVYVDVATLRSWLDGEVTRRGYDSSVYSLD